MTPQKPNNAPRKGNTYDQDYKTRYNFHYYQENGHVPKNCIGTHFRGNYKRWLNEIVCFSCLKIGLVTRNYPTRSLTLRNPNKNGKGEVDVKQVRNQMNTTWRNKEDCSSTSQSEVTSSNGLGDHTSTN